MTKMLVKFGMLIATIYTVSKWLIIPVVSVRISDPALITVLICSIVVMLTIVLPFIMIKD